MDYGVLNETTAYQLCHRPPPSVRDRQDGSAPWNKSRGTRTVGPIRARMQRIDRMMDNYNQNMALRRRHVVSATNALADALKTFSLRQARTKFYTAKHLARRARQARIRALRGF